MNRCRRDEEAKRLERDILYIGFQSLSFKGRIARIGGRQQTVQKEICPPPAAAAAGSHTCISCNQKKKRTFQKLPCCYRLQAETGFVTMWRHVSRRQFLGCIPAAPIICKQASKQAS